MIKLLLILFIFPSWCWATPTTETTVNWEFQENSGNSNNSMGFDYNNANFDTTLSATGGTGNSCTVSSSNYSFVAGDVGNWVFIQSGTNWLPGWYQIGSISGTSAVLNSAIGQAVVVNTSNGFNANNPYAYGASKVAGCASTATPSSGVWGLDYTQTTTALKTDSTLASATGTTVPSTVTDSGLSFGVNTVGNFIHVTAGTNWLPGYYEIVSVSAGVATLDRAVGSLAALTSGTYFLGGSGPIAALTTAFLGDTNGGLIGGNITWMKFNATTYTLPVSATATGANCTAQGPCPIVGYNTIHGDNPTGNNRPSITSGIFTISLAQYQDVYNITESGTSGNGFVGNTGSIWKNDKFTNTSTTANRIALVASTDVLIENCEFVSQNGFGLELTGAGDRVIGNYIHDSSVGIEMTNLNPTILYNIIESVSTDGINFTQTGNVLALVKNNTFYNTDTPSATGILFVAGLTNSLTYNNIFYGFSTALSEGTATQPMNIGDYNDLFNNTTNYSLFVQGINDTFIDPQFTSHGQITGATATSSASILTDSGKTFTSALIGQYLHVTGGTGATVGIYLITANTTTTLTVNNPIGTDSSNDLTYYITVNHNYTTTGIGLNGYPGAFPGLSVTGFLTQGAVQNQSGGSSSGTGLFIQ